MGEVELPLVDADTAIDAAIDVMRRSARSGLVTEVDGKLTVLSLAELVRTWRERGNVRLAQMEPSKPTASISLATLPQRLSVLKWRPIGHDEVRNIMRRQGADHAIVSPGTPLLTVITAHEDIANALFETAVVCRCSVDPQHHIWRPSEVTLTGYCNDCGGSLNCS